MNRPVLGNKTKNALIGFLACFFLLVGMFGPLILINYEVRELSSLGHILKTTEFALVVFFSALISIGFGFISYYISSD